MPRPAGDQPTFAQRFAELLAERGLTSSSFTKLVYDTTGVWISEGTQGNWRRGAGIEPRPRTLSAMAQVTERAPRLPTRDLRFAGAHVLDDHRRRRDHVWIH